MTATTMTLTMIIMMKKKKKRKTFKKIFGRFLFAVLSMNLSSIVPKNNNNNNNKTMIMTMTMMMMMMEKKMGKQCCSLNYNLLFNLCSLFLPQITSYNMLLSSIIR